MEENNMNVAQAENMGNETEVQGAAGGEKGKLFTQDEVNSFIQSRVSRMKAQAAKDAKAEYDQKLADLQAREMKLLIKEQLSKRGMSAELADIITCADEDDLSNKLDTLQKIYGDKAKKEESPSGHVQVGAFIPKHMQTFNRDPVREAMGMKG